MKPKPEVLKARGRIWPTRRRSTAVSAALTRARPRNKVSMPRTLSCAARRQGWPAPEAQLEVAEQVQLQIRQQETNVEARERQVDQARAQLETANLNLSYTEVRAPFDGFVTKRNVQPGTLVQAGTALFSLVSPERVGGGEFQGVAA